MSGYARGFHLAKLPPSRYNRNNGDSTGTPCGPEGGRFARTESDGRLSGRGKKQVKIIAAAVLLVGAVFLAFTGPRLYLLASLKMGHSRAQSPALYRVPAARTISAPRSPEMPARIPYPLQDFYFTAAWEATRQIRQASVQGFVFPGERSLLASVRPQEGSVLKTLLKGTAEESRKMQALLGADHTTSEFALVDACLRVTPASAGLRSSVAELTRIRTLLIVKAAFPRGAAIYRLQFDQLQGFQFGRPADDSQVFVYLYTPEDRLVRLNFSGFTQPEIDRLVDSLRPTSPAIF